MVILVWAQVLQGCFGRTPGPPSAGEIPKGELSTSWLRLGDNLVQSMPALRKQLSDTAAEEHAYSYLYFQT